MNRFSWAMRAMVMGCAVSMSVAVAACGDEAASGPESFAGVSQEALIQADKGGTLAVGAVKISVPEGALEKDTTLTARVHDKKQHPQRNKVAIDVYEFGPKGTTFSKEVELEFDLKGVSVGKGQRAQVAELDEDSSTWKVLPGSKHEGNKVRAGTKHFSFYTVILTEEQTGDGVALCDADYSPCGGDISGTWRFTKGCINGFAEMFGVPDTSDGGELCADSTAEVVLTVGGSANFAADASYSIAQQIRIEARSRYSLACLRSVSYDCATLDGVVQGDFCVWESSSEFPVDSAGSYATSGSSLQLSADIGTLLLGTVIDPTVDYCVEGDTLALRLTGTDDYDRQVYYATRVSE